MIWLKFALCVSNDEIQIAVLWQLSAFTVKKRDKTEREIEADWYIGIKVSAISIALSWRWMPDGICCRRRQLKSMDISYVWLWNQWNPWEHWSVFRSESHSSSLWFWLTCHMWTELSWRATLAVLWLALCPAALPSGTVSPQNVLIAQSNSLPPHGGPLCPLSSFNLFQFGLYSYPSLIHSDFIAYNFSPLSTFLSSSLSVLLRWESVGHQAVF